MARGLAYARRLSTVGIVGYLADRSSSKWPLKNRLLRWLLDNYGLGVRRSKTVDALETTDYLGQRVVFVDGHGESDRKYRLWAEGRMAHTLKILKLEAVARRISVLQVPEVK